jgi:hypothetical protein
VSVSSGSSYRWINPKLTMTTIIAPAVYIITTLRDIEAGALGKDLLYPDIIVFLLQSVSSLPEYGVIG